MFQVTHSECESADNSGFHVTSWVACRDLCKVFSNSGIGCSFSAWSSGSSQLNCRLYTVPFWQYLATCKLLGGPAYLTGCDVLHPEDNTCQAVRLDLFYTAYKERSYINCLIIPSPCQAGHLPVLRLPAGVPRQCGVVERPARPPAPSGSPTGSLSVESA